MSARKWPIYTMSVGNVFLIAHPTVSLLRSVRQRAADRGLKMCIRKAVPQDWYYLMRIV
jgi:hypothetical protein